MTKEYFIELAKYSNWADKFLMDWLVQLNKQQWEQPITSSFNSIKDTVVHMVSAKKIWLDFWTNKPNPVYLSADFTGTKEELIAIWQKASDDLENFVQGFPETNYNQLIAVTYPNGRLAEMEFWKTLPHYVNHATYHRGQAVTMLRQAGFADFRNTDLFTYFILNN
jgi:uncharacterized damage-inducible protein DinB